MKTIPPPCPEPESGPKYWRSLDQLADTPEFREWVEREFPSGASELTDPTTRRHFVKIMSASFLLAGLGLTGCRRPEERIMPHSKMPENQVHGVPQYFATAFPLRASATPLVVTSHDGRPTKIEGNDRHPDSNGATDQFAQASILNLYDPDRAISFRQGGHAKSREQALDMLTELAAKAAASQGQGLCFLLERSSSPTRERLQARLAQKLPQARWFVYEPVDFDIHRQAATLAFGQPVAPANKLDAAKVILSLDHDFIGAEEDSWLNVRRFAKGRKIHRPEDEMNRLYVVEALYSLTGANADHRLRVASGLVQAVAARLAMEVFKLTGKHAELANALAALAEPAKPWEKWIVEAAADLVKQGAGGLVMAGYRQPLAVHLLAHAMNSALGAVGRAVQLLPAPPPAGESLEKLAAELNAGKVDTLVIVGGNPAYNAPAAMEWPKLQAKAKAVIRLGYYEDETAEGCAWHLPMAHYLESWGDARTADGTLVPVQPLINPIFGGLTELEVLARIGGLAATRPYDLVRETFRELSGSAEENAWRKFLHDGFLAHSAAKPVAGQLQASAVASVLSEAKPVAAPGAQNLEVVFYRSYSTDDGRFNNNGWLQETPDPITKLTWDNAILLSPKTAQALNIGGLDEKAKGNKTEKGLFFNQVAALELNGRKLSGPVWIQPGMADFVVGLALGYGRTKTGRIGRLADGSPAGFNAYALKAGTEAHAQGARLTVLPGARRQLASTQEHGSMEGRPLIREANKEDFARTPTFARHMDLDSPAHTGHIANDAQGNPKPIYPRPQLNGMHQWGMVVDLTSCVGCTACMVACQSENNIPIVGKEQVAKGREMSWVRLDRYYAGTVEDPQIAYQPVFCLHCENAPCESVCPVNATVHDDEGLNLMTYNRCVGTRYCSNNCPYKVRRFNFFDYNRRPLDQLYRSPFSLNKDGQVEAVRWLKDPDKGTVPADQWDLLKLARNPDVTVRMRGVMEKCTYCLQRLEQAKIAKKVKARASGDVRLNERDGSVPKTACQQACPAEAITFGDIADPDSQVSKLKKLPHNYSLLGFLDTRPRTTYLARIRNPNPRMPDYDARRPHPQTLNEYISRHGSPLESHGAKGKKESVHPPKGAHQ